MKTSLVILRELVDLLMIENKGQYPSTLFSKIRLLLRNPIRAFKALTGKELNISYADAVLTTRCTLNCQGCGALMEYYKKPEHIAVGRVIQSLRVLIETCDHIKRIHLLGGEPLCYPWLYEVLEFLLDQDKVYQVGITTNGTLLLRDERVKTILRNPKFEVDISFYGNDVSIRASELVQQLKDNDIKYKLNNKGRGWIDFGGFENRKRPETELKKQFTKCLFKWCRVVYNGKLYRCSRSAHGTNLNLIPVKEDDYIELLPPTQNLRKRLWRYLYGPVQYIEACKFCDVVQYDPPRLWHIQAGVQSHSSRS